MNKQDFSQGIGRLFEIDFILGGMQEAYETFNSFGESIGNYTIVKGCEKSSNGLIVSDGYVYFDGELFPFKGGTVQSTVILKQETVRKPFEDGSEPEVLFIRYVTFGTGASAIDWKLFQRPLTNLELTEKQAAKAEKTALEELEDKINTINQRLDVFVEGGAMVFWNKPASEIPDGWQEVTDWRGRFPVGYNPYQTDFNTIGKEGGSRTHTLTTAQMPRHKHSNNSNFNLFTGLATNVNNSSSDGSDNIGSDDELAINNITSTIKQQMTEQYAGESESFSILNPYRTVLFIEYVGN